MDPMPKMLRPTPEQEKKLDFLLAQARRVYNTALEQRIAAYQGSGKGLRYPARWTTFRDLQHQLSRRLVREHDLIGLEGMSLAFMNQDRQLSLSSHDAGWGGLRHMLEYSRQVEKTPAVRVHRCPSCGLVLDRGVNAARNIPQLALDTLATPTARTGQEERNLTQRGEIALRSCPLRDQ